MSKTLDRAAVLADAAARMKAQHDKMDHPEKGPIGQYCVFWAGHVVAALRERGVTACVNAGTAHWIVSPDPGDGQGAFTFGYEFEMTPTTVERILGGVLPELHAWAIIPPDHSEDGRPWLIDPTVPYIPENCRRVLGFDPVNAFPEPYWFPLDTPPEPSKCYRPHRTACGYVNGILRTAGIL